MSSEAIRRFWEGSYQEAIDQWEKDCQNVTDEAASVLRCNIAKAYFELGLYRKCGSECDAAIRLFDRNARAYILKGHSLTKRKKMKDARQAWQSAISKTEDIFLHQEISDLLAPSDVEPTPSAVPVVAPIPTAITPKPSSSVDDNGEESSLSLRNTVPVTDYESLAESSQMVAEQGLVQNGTGNPVVDRQLALGFLQVNTGKLAQARKTFDQIIATTPNVPLAAYLGRGTAFALENRLNEAIVDFTSATRKYPRSDDAWKRRGQARAAKGNFSDAILDLTEALRVIEDADTYLQRGLIYYKQHNYNRAEKDFDSALKINPNCTSSLNQKGLCNTAVGLPWDAVELHQKALEISPQDKLAFVYMGQAYKEWGKYEDSYAAYSRALELDSNHCQSYYLRAQSSFFAGLHLKAIKDYQQVINRDASLLESHQSLGVTLHGIGRLSEALVEYSICQKISPGHVTWYNKEVALYYSSRYDEPISSFKLDDELDPYFKEAWCKRLDPRGRKGFPGKQALPSSFVDSTFKPITDFEGDQRAVLEAAKSIGPKIQSQCPGYISNRRQWAMCGLSVVEVAQQLQQCWQGKLDENWGWRDMYEISVKWRQFSEPNDPVVWVDKLSPEQFAEGFGSHTPMITGQTHVVRYSPMYPKSMGIMQELVDQLSLSPSDAATFRKSSSLSELHDIVGKDFWVCTPCESTAFPGQTMEGTRLTLQIVPPEGLEFSIRTPGTPQRWKDYAKELDYVFGKLREEATKEERDIEEISKWILAITFYWFNFMPLSRGTAACGYIVLLGMFLSVDIDIDARVPAKQQVDWESILNPSPSIFINALKPWMYPARKPSTLLRGLPSLRDTFPTLRHRIDALTTVSTSY